MGKIKRTIGFLLQHPFASRHLFRSFLRLFLWQLQTSISPSHLFIKPFLASVRFYARKGLTGITGNIYAGLHEFNDMSFLLHFLREGDIFFDIGANVGSYTLLAAGVCRTKTIAIEAAASTYGILCENIHLNNLQDKAVAINAAAGATKGTLRFSMDEDTTNHIIADDEVKSDMAAVDIIVIDELGESNPPALIKIDVEGYEREVLKGMYRILRQPVLKAIIIELNGSANRYGFDEYEIHVLLLSAGFKPYNYDPFSRGLTEIASYGSYNTIYCRDVEFILGRLESATPFNIWEETI